VKPEPQLLNKDRLRKLGFVVGVTAAHLGVFSIMARADAPVPLPDPTPPITVFLFRPPPPPPPPPAAEPARTQGGEAPAAPSRIHVTPKPADKPRELPAPPVQAPEPALVTGLAPVAGPTPGLGQGGTGAGTGTGDGDGNGPGSGGTGPMILRPATSAEIQSVAPPAVRGVRRPPGRVVVNCVIRTDQRLGDCRIVDESPLGFGFGEQALRATAFFRYRPPMTAAGRPVEGQRVTTFVNMGGRGGR
jgi:protein TonB